MSFIDLTKVELTDNFSENATVLIEDNGEIKRTKKEVASNNLKMNVDGNYLYNNLYDYAYNLVYPTFVSANMQDSSSLPVAGKVVGYNVYKSGDTYHLFVNYFIMKSDGYAGQMEPGTMSKVITGNEFGSLKGHWANLTNAEY